MNSLQTDRRTDRQLSEIADVYKQNQFDLSVEMETVGQVVWKSTTTVNGELSVTAASTTLTPKSPAICSDLGIITLRSVYLQYLLLPSGAGKAPWHPGLQTHYSLKKSCESCRVRSAGNVTVITRNLPRNLRVGKIENYA